MSGESAQAPAEPAPTSTTVAAASTTVPGTQPPVTEAPVDNSEEVASARRQANLALGVGGAAALAAVVALVMAARHRPGSGRGEQGEEQEW